MKIYNTGIRQVDIQVETRIKKYITVYNRYFFYPFFQFIQFEDFRIPNEY